MQTKTNRTKRGGVIYQIEGVGFWTRHPLLLQK
jgi:hypothetical protein